MRLPPFTGKLQEQLINVLSFFPGIDIISGFSSKCFKKLPTAASPFLTGIGSGREEAWIRCWSQTALEVETMADVSPTELHPIGVPKAVVVGVCSDNSILAFPSPEMSKSWVELPILEILRLLALSWREHRMRQFISLLGDPWQITSALQVSVWLFLDRFISFSCCCQYFILRNIPISRPVVLASSVSSFAWAGLGLELL